MTDTSLGLPSEPVVDGNKNLTSSWLNALGEIEDLNALKQKYLEIANANTDELVAAVEAAEQALDDILSQIIPNRVITSSFLDTEVSIATTGVPHGMGTDSYIPHFRYTTTGSFGGRLFMLPVSTGNSGPTITKNAVSWTYSQSLPGTDISYFTFTITR